MSIFCVLVACSDDRKDIFDICFAHSDRIWRDYQLPRYVGLTSAQPDQHGFKVVTSPHKEWRKAVADYVDALPGEIEYILLMVEDVLFLEPVNCTELIFLARDMRKNKMLYLRLAPLCRNWLGWLMDVWDTGLDMNDYRKIPRNEPYYSSTEMVIWDRNYLRRLLEYPVDAWSFEHIVNSDHWAVWKRFLNQHQIVQKGHWNRAAPRLLRKQDLSIGRNSRPFQTWSAWLRGHWQNLNFALFGFTSVRIKRWLRP